MSIPVKFCSGLQSDYDKLTVRDTGTLYVITDTQRIYKGDILISSQNILKVDELPDVAEAKTDAIYVVLTDNDLDTYILSDDSTKFVRLSNNNVSINDIDPESIATSISIEDASDSKLTTEKAVSDAISNALIDVSYDPSKPGDYDEWTFTAVDGTVKKISTPKEVFLQSASYSSTTKILTLTMNNCTKVDADLSTLIPASISTEDVEVPITKDITVELGTGGSLGGYKTGDIITAGTTVQQIVSKLLAKQVPPTYTSPKVSITNNGGTVAKLYEIGTPISPKIKATFTQNDAGNLSNIAIYRNTPEPITSKTYYLTGYWGGRDITIDDNYVLTWNTENVEITIPIDGEAYIQIQDNEGNYYKASGWLGYPGSYGLPVQLIQYTEESSGGDKLCISTSGNSDSFKIVFNPSTLMLNYSSAINTLSNTSDMYEEKIGESTSSPYMATDGNYPLTMFTSYVAKATYETGPVKNDNLGNPYPTGQIQSGTVISTNYTFTPYRQGYFYGVLDTDNTIALTSDVIRSGSKKNGAYAAGNLPLIKASDVANRKRIFIACPATNTGVTKVIMPSAMNADCTADFKKQSTIVNVEGANGYTSIAYNVWVYEPASISDDQTFTVTLG